MQTKTNSTQKKVVRRILLQYKYWHFKTFCLDNQSYLIELIKNKRAIVVRTKFIVSTIVFPIYYGYHQEKHVCFCWVASY